MSSFDTIHTQFVDNLQRAYQITEVTDAVVDIAKSAIESLRKYTGINPTTGANPVDNQLGLLNKLHESPAIKDMMPVVYGQQIVLFVSSFESYLKDITRALGNNYISSIKWPDKASGKIDLALLSRDKLTIGDLVLGILEQHNISFQDLQATKRFFSEYLGIDLCVDSPYEQRVILGAAIRHAIIHNAGVADSQFIKQIRNLDPDLIREYQENSPIELASAMVTELRDSFILYATEIRDTLNQKIVSE